MILQSKKSRLLLILSAIFITSAITAELISSKLFQVHLKLGSLDFGTYVSIVGILPWPIVFLTTDIVNEFFGKKVVRFISILTAVMIGYCFFIVSASMQPHAFTGIPEGTIHGVANDTQFNAVFGQSKWIIVGSISAFIISQLVDNWVFWFFKKRTGAKFIWLRSTGSTVISQLIDSFVVLFIAFVIPGIFTMEQFWITAITNYVLKLLIAVGLTPFIYLFHWIVEKYLGEEAAHIQEEKVAEESTNSNI
jgi:uncharacterized integral membrane protein (TIGR00697 family)